LVFAAAMALGLSAADKVVEKKGQDCEEKKDPNCPLCEKTFTGLALRNIGPAVQSGRISDIAVDPTKPARWFVAVASGGVWRTENAGTTWAPVFDSAGSYSVGCVTLDPKNPQVVWVGSGENNSQRSVGYGDGIYRSDDGGNTWKNMGLKESEHIAKILVDPRDSKVVYAACQGPLWKAGGDRGLYKTTDGGKTWMAVLTVSENTGVTDVAFDPRAPDVLYAASYQRRRHVWTLINGGPESAIHKSTDAGATWTKLSTGLPTVDMGRIGLAVPPGKPDRIYAVVEAADKKGGLYRSDDAGSTWKKVGDYCSDAAQYYHELVPDMANPDRVYALDYNIMVSEDGGKSFHKAGETFKHVDNHALWVDPSNSDHLLAGCDGGVYESLDRASTWRFFANLPVTQFYRATPDNSLPFYFVYGGTQDNNTVGGPSRTLSDSGITNADWFVPVGGDGFKTQVDPQDPNIVYSQYQYAGIVRFDRRNGEAIDIQPQPGEGEEALRWNWDSPLIISPHSHVRLYFGANRLFRSDDRGDSWKAVSQDLTRRLDRNALPVMGTVWSVDAVAKNASTSFFGNIVSLAESPLQEGLIYTGTDDGLVQITEDGGATWRKVEKFPGIPDRAYISDLEASPLKRDTVFATFDNHKMGDFKPYALRSDDRGKIWTSVAGDLPERGTVYALALDDKNPELLFAGTEFGLFFTVDGGKHWVSLKGGMPPIAVRDLEIQRREGDLVAATFGRGIAILDDYTPLRQMSKELLEKDAVLFPVKKAWMFIPSTPLGLKDKAFQGDSFFNAPNPPFGAVFTFHLKEKLKTRKEKRQEQEAESRKAGKPVAYPPWDALRAEDREEEAAVILTVRDEEGNVVRRITGSVEEGFHRIAWDLRYPPADPIQLDAPPPDDPYSYRPAGPLASPGTYIVALSKRLDGVETEMGEPQRFDAAPLGAASLPAADRAALTAFERKTARLQRAVLGALETAAEARRRMDHLKKALEETPGKTGELAAQTRALEARLKEIQVALSGDATVRKRNEPDRPSIVDRVQGVVGGHWSATCAPTLTHRMGYDIAAKEFAPVLQKLRQLVEVDLKGLEAAAESAGAPWTPGRVPTWNPE
jgi:photosystem II stability/assembly factor-like uncharacterized protein